MIPKKDPKISLENKKGMFFQIGLAVTLIAVLISFEWKSYDKSNYNLGDLNLDDMEEEIIPSPKPDYYPVIPITPPNNNLSFTGELLVEIDSPFLFGNGNIELVNFSIRIQDQNLSWSNTITTPNISVNRE